MSVEIFDMDKLSEDTDKPTKLYKDEVKQSMLNDIHTLRDKGFRFSDIAVLVRNNRDGSDIADYISKNNIPVMSSDSIMLNSSDKVRLIIYTLRCLQDDKNDVAKLALSFYRNSRSYFSFPKRRLWILPDFLLLLKDVTYDFSPL